VDDTRVVPSANSAKPTLSTQTGRALAIRNLILKAHWVCLRPLPEPETLRLIVAAWEDLLTAVPTSALEGLYQAAWALPDRHSGWPVTADELLTVWRQQAAAPPPRRHVSALAPDAD
jgi:hypothetical protein